MHDAKINCVKEFTMLCQLLANVVKKSWNKGILNGNGENKTHFQINEYE